MKNVSPSRSQHEQQPEPVKEKLIAFLTRFRTPILATVAGIVIVTVVLVIVMSVQASRAEAALLAVEDLQDEYEQWMQLEKDERSDAYSLLADSAASLIEEYPRTYAAVRARILDARALSELELWEAASRRFLEAADASRGTYLEPVSLMGAAVAAENAGDADRALALHRRIAEDFAGESAEVPRAMFSIGRILEQRGDIAEAAEAYRRLVSSYPNSSWTNLARNRIISLTVEGRIGG